MHTITRVENVKNDKKTYKILIFSTFALCILPFILNLLGTDFTITNPYKGLPTIETKFAFRLLLGPIIHALLEWTSVAVAVTMAIFCFIHYLIKKDFTVTVLGIALLFSGLMDCFHTLAATRIIHAQVPANQFIPFTWALSAGFHAFIIISGVSYALFMNKKFLHTSIYQTAKPTRQIIVFALIYFIILVALMAYSSTSANLPRIIFPDALISRPYDVIPLILYILSFPLFYLLYNQTKTIFAGALMVGLIPAIGLELHMAFGSTRLFDNHFNIAHYLKIIEFMVPFAGLMIDYSKDNIKLLDLNRSLRKAQSHNEKLNNELEQRVEERTEELKSEINVRREAEEDLRHAMSQLKEAQESLIQSEKMASLGGLVAGVAHEVNTPLGISVTAASHLHDNLTKLLEAYDEKKLSESVLKNFIADSREFITILNTNLVRASKLVKSFKQIAVDQHDLDMRHTNLNECIEDVVLSLKPKLKKTPHIVQCDCPHEIEFITCPGSLAQIITNLINNSLLHAFHDKDKGKMTITCTENNEYVTIIFSDDGCGISEEIGEKIFDPFTTTKRGQGGTGLGMNIVHNIITQNLKGHIHVQSKTGGGTTFTIELPKTPTT